MTSRSHQAVHPYSVKIETATGRAASLPLTLLTPTQVEQARIEFKRMAQGAGIKGARIDVQRVAADDYHRVIHEAKASLRKAKAKAA